jgi:hypothetical protein
VTGVIPPFEEIAPNSIYGVDESLLVSDALT